MSEENLSALLDLSINPPSEGISNVNYTAMRKLLHYIVQRLPADRETANEKSARADPDADRSLLEERVPEIFEQPSSAPLQLPSETKPLSLPTSDTTREQKVSKSTSLIQELFKKNQELEEKTNNQREEMDKLQSQLNQNASLIQDLLNKNLKLEEETNKRWQEMETLQNQINESMSLMQDLSQENQELKDEISDLKKNMDTHQNKSLMQDLSKENQELREETNNLRTEMAMLKNQFSQVYETGPEISGLGGEHDKSALELTASEDRDSISVLEGLEEDLKATAPRNAVQQLYVEVENIKQELQELKTEQKGTSEQEMQDKITELKSEVQVAILKLQDEFETLHSTTTQAMREGVQEKTHIEHLYNDVKELDEKVDTKADIHTVETTVFATTQQLKGMFQELLSSNADLEENYHTVTEKIFRELKLSHTEIDRLRKQVENLQKAQIAESDNAAIVKKRLMTRFNCLSCDRPVNMKTPGPRVEVLPVLPGFPIRQHKRTSPSTNLGQSSRSSTKRSMTQTRSDSFGSDGLNNNGYGEYNVNRSQLSTSIRRNLKQLSPMRQRQSEADMICIGTGCFKKEKQWIPEDSLPQTLQSQQQMSSVPSAKENLKVSLP